MIKGFRKGYRKTNRRGQNFNRGTRQGRGRKGVRRSYFNDKVKKHQFTKRKNGMNPIGRDGKPWKCTTCGSEHHLRDECPEKGKHGTSGSSKQFPVRTGSRPKPKRKPQSGHQRGRSHLSTYETEGEEEPQEEEEEIGMNHFVRPFGEWQLCGSSSDKEESGKVINLDMYPVWECYDESEETTERVYLRKSDRLEHGEALLLDTGANKNLAGGKWVERMDKINSSYGIRKSEKSDLGYTAALGGVGTGVQRTRTKVQVPTTIAGKLGTFTATYIEDSDLPALLGMQTMQDANAIIDLRHHRLILPDSQGDVKLQYKKGTSVLPLIEAPGGFLMLPCSPDVRARSNSKHIKQ